MKLFPAIDLKDGQCVRLRQGLMSEATVFADDPAAQALAFERLGFAYLHVVDLNGAFQGGPVNGAAVRAILQILSIPVQLGGGIRSLAQIGNWLEEGIARVILGTAAVREPQLVREAARRHPGRRALGVGEVKFTGMVTPKVKLIEYTVDFTRVIDRKLKLGIANGTMRADGEVIYSTTDMKVGLFQA
jgi:phosphoribosylformimino-5-aminoimidazole carboxamide ribonucleotide (ProFAR) isomerase